MATREPVVLLLRRARAAGVTLTRTARGVSFDIPQTARGFALELGRREQYVAALFDWRHAPVAAPSPCLLCGRPAMLRDPSDHAPAHKTCVDRLLED